MAKKFGSTIKKLQDAINSTGKIKLTINKTQFYSIGVDRPIDLIIIKEAIVQSTGRIKYVERFSSSSDVSITLFLRDIWYELNGWEIPIDERWEETKKKYYEKQAERGRKKA